MSQKNPYLNFKYPEYYKKRNKILFSSNMENIKTLACVDSIVEAAKKGFSYTKQCKENASLHLDSWQHILRIALQKNYHVQSTLYKYFYIS